MSTPIVTIVVLAYNHSLFLEECLKSVFSQTYTNLEIFIIDDFSNDDSQIKIASLMQKNNWKAQCIFNQSNIGNCKSFNRALELAKGKYIIDLAADDVLPFDSLSKKIDFFEDQEEDCSMTYSDAEYLDIDSKSLGIYSKLKKITDFPSGAIFEDILARHFICPPTVMFRKKSLKEVNGYNESLAYEDFDIWLRLSKISSVAFQNEITVKRRIDKGSLSNQFQGKKRTEMLTSTLQICQRVASEVENDSEKKALVQRMKYELRFAMRQGQKEIVSEYLKILKRLREESFVHKILSCFY